MILCNVFEVLITWPVRLEPYAASSLQSPCSSLLLDRFAKDIGLTAQAGDLGRIAAFWTETYLNIVAQVCSASSSLNTLHTSLSAGCLDHHLRHCLMYGAQ